MSLPYETYSVNLPHLLVGVDTVAQVGELAKDLGSNRILIVTDPGVTKAGLLEKIQKSLKLLGYPISNVKTINVYEIAIDSDSGESAKAEIEDACRRLLANPVIHNYSIEITEL